MSSDLNRKDVIFIFGTRPEYQRMIDLMKIFIKKHYIIKVFYIPQKKNLLLEKEIEYQNIKVSTFRRGRDEDLFSFINKSLYENIKDKSVIIVSSDTTVCAVSSIFSNNMGHTLIKINAGLRDGNFNQQEYKNAVISDHLSNLAFCESEENKQNLLKEFFKEEKIILTNTTLVGEKHIEILLKNKYSEKNGPMIVSLHRLENLNNGKMIWLLLREIAKRNCLCKVIINNTHDIKIPRSKYLELSEPIKHQRFLETLCKTRLLITDSKNTAEEALFMNTPCVLITNNKNNNKRDWPIFLNLEKNNELSTIKSNIRQSINKGLSGKKRSTDEPYKNTSEYIFQKIFNYIK